MSILDDWIDNAEQALDLTPGSLPKELRDDLLGLTRDVAHGVARIAGPLTCYLAGLAVARGGDPAAVASALRDLVPAQQSGAQQSSAQQSGNQQSGAQPDNSTGEVSADGGSDAGPAEEAGLGRS